MTRATAADDRSPTEPTEVPQVADGCDALDLEPPPPGEGVQLQLELPLMPGEQRNVCRLVVMDRTVNMSWSEGMFTQGSHHGNTWVTSYRGSLPSENIRGEPVADAGRVADCIVPQAEWDALGVLAMGRPPRGTPALNTEGMLPANVAVKVREDDVLLLDFHMVNLSEKPIRACYKQNLWGIPDAQVKCWQRSRTCSIAAMWSAAATRVSR